MPPPIKRNLRRLHTLTQAETGPTGRTLDQIAQEIVETARENATKFNPNLLSKFPEILNTIESVRRGNEIRIGVRPDKPAGPKNFAYYLVSKELKEHNWLQPAVEEVMLKHGAVRGAGNTVVLRGAGGRFLRKL